VPVVGNDLRTLYFHNHVGAYVAYHATDLESPASAWFVHKLVDPSPVNIIEGFDVFHL
jgi:hypothetical protein